MDTWALKVNEPNRRGCIKASHVCRFIAAIWVLTPVKTGVQRNASTQVHKFVALRLGMCDPLARVYFFRKSSRNINNFKYKLDIHTIAEQVEHIRSNKTYCRKENFLGLMNYKS